MATPLMRAITNLDADRVRITLSTPALQQINKESGDIRGTNVLLRFELATGGGAYVTAA